MKIFNVEVEARDRVQIEAETEEQAIELAKSKAQCDWEVVYSEEVE